MKLADELAITEEMIDAALRAPVPGGSQVWVWLPQQDAWTPHQTARDVMRCALAAALSTDRAPADVEGLVGRLRAGVQAIGSEPGGARPIYAIATADQEMRRAADTILTLQAEVSRLSEALDPVRHWYESDEHEPRDSVDIVRDVVSDLQQDRAEVLRLRRLIADPPKHRYWGAGEPDCPRDLKAGNGELHTLRCKLCGNEDARDEICRAALEPTSKYGHGSAGPENNEG